jgi:hypothetical protein
VICKIVWWRADSPKPSSLSIGVLPALFPCDLSAHLRPQAHHGRLDGRLDRRLRRPLDGPLDGRRSANEEFQPGYRWFYGQPTQPRLISKLRSRVQMRKNQAKEVDVVDCQYAPVCSRKKGVRCLEAESLIAVSVSVFRVIAMESAV